MFAAASEVQRCGHGYKLEISVSLSVEVILLTLDLLSECRATGLLKSSYLCEYLYMSHQGECQDKTPKLIGRIAESLGGHFCVLPSATPSFIGFRFTSEAERKTSREAVLDAEVMRYVTCIAYVHKYSSGGCTLALIAPPM